MTGIYGPEYNVFGDGAISGEQGFVRPLIPNFYADLFRIVGRTTLSRMAAHHVIPAQYGRATSNVSGMMRALTEAGYFSIADGIQNNIWLPMKFPEAAMTGLSLHASVPQPPAPFSEAFHARYNQLVGKALDLISGSYPLSTNWSDAGLRERGAEIAGLQAYLKEQLSANVVGETTAKAISRAVVSGLAAGRVLGPWAAAIAALGAIGATIRDPRYTQAARLKLQAIGDSRRNAFSPDHASGVRTELAAVAQVARFT